MAPRGRYSAGLVAPGGGRGWRRRLRVGVLGFTAAQAALAATMGPRALLVPLSADERARMRWAGAHTTYEGPGAAIFARGE